MTLSITAPIATSYFSKIYSGKRPSSSESSAMEVFYQSSLDSKLIQDAQVTNLVTDLKSSSKVIEVITTTEPSQTTTAVVISDHSNLYPSVDLSASPIVSLTVNLNWLDFVNTLYQTETTRYQNEQIRQNLRDISATTDLRV